MGGWEGVGWGERRILWTKLGKTKSCIRSIFTTGGGCRGRGGGGVDLN